MSTHWPKWIGCSLTLLFLATATPVSSGRTFGVQTTEAPSGRALVNQYCVGCHNQRTQTAGLALDEADIDNVAGNPEIWEKVVAKLSFRPAPADG